MADTDESESRSARNEELSTRLHDRARESGVELHELTIGLAMGLLATYFVALTAKSGAPLTVLQ